LDLLWSRQNTTAPEIIPTLATFAERLATIAESSEVSICRLAALVTRVAEYPDPGIALARHFCRDQWITGPLNRPEGFELHTHKVFTLLDEIRVNSWIRIKAIKIGVGPYNRISIEQDINTLAEEVDKRHFTRQELASWLEAAGGELDTILAMYFPDNRPNS
jgi:hypothetical protein